MQYMLIACETADEVAPRDGPDAAAYWGAWTAYSQAIAQSGVMLSGNALKPPHTATTVRLKDGSATSRTGPTPTPRNSSADISSSTCRTSTRALEWAARMPCAGRGAVEVRPVLEMQAG